MVRQSQHTGSANQSEHILCFGKEELHQNSNSTERSRQAGKRGSAKV